MTDAMPSDLLAEVDANVFTAAVSVFSCWALDLAVQARKPWDRV